MAGFVILRKWRLFYGLLNLVRQCETNVANILSPSSLFQSFCSLSAIWFGAQSQSWAVTHRLHSPHPAFVIPALLPSSLISLEAIFLTQPSKVSTSYSSLEIRGPQGYSCQNLCVVAIIMFYCLEPLPSNIHSSSRYLSVGGTVKKQSDYDASRRRQSAAHSLHI